MMVHNIYYIIYLGTIETMEMVKNHQTILMYSLKNLSYKMTNL